MYFIVGAECSYNDVLRLAPPPRPCRALAGGYLALRLFFRADVPSQCAVNVRFDPSIDRRPYRAEFVADRQDRQLVMRRLKLPDRVASAFFPDRIDVLIGDYRFRKRLPTLELLSEDRFYEYLVLLLLEQIGFQCDWLSARDPRFPNGRAIFKRQPPPEGEVFQVECTTQRPYDSRKMYTDYAKFRREKDVWKLKFTRLLIAPLYPDLTDDVKEGIERLDDTVTLVTYPDLIQLSAQVRRGILSPEKAYDLLCRPGQLRLAPRISIKTLLPRTLTIAYNFTLRSE